MGLFARLLATDPGAVRDAYQQWERTQHNNLSRSVEAMVNMGYEDITDGNDRAGFVALGRRWAYRHAVAGPAAPTDQPCRPAKRDTCAALIDGQLCGGTLINTPVCPRCALGKSGVAATLTCDVCGHVSAIMRSDA